MKIRSLKGTQDILQDNVEIWRRIEDISRKKLGLYGYGEIRTPIIEEGALFTRSIGEETDIVKKQMYSFKDQGGRTICLRPEETAAVVRAYLEHHMDKSEGLTKLFYIGPMFRSERPQAGRLRQFHQIGVEVIGSSSPYVDAEVIILLDELLSSYNLGDYIFRINSLGCERDKEAVRKALRKELKYHLNALCDDCKRRYETNILRILDCKNPSCRRIVASVSSLQELLCKDCAGEFKRLQDILDMSDLKYELCPLLVRGLDYYTKIVFEVIAKGLGAQDAVAAGGRYDTLVSEFGGPDKGACGFAIGVERVIEALSGTSPSKALDGERDTIFIATLGETAYDEGFKILTKLRKAGLAADIDYQQKSLKAQMRYADRLKARFAVIIGEDELKNKAAVVRDMADSSQKTVPLAELIETLRTKN